MDDGRDRKIVELWFLGSEVPGSAPLPTFNTPFSQGSNDECVTIESSSEGKTLQNFKCSDTSKADGNFTFKLFHTF